jgi:hypothetical protein
LNAETKILVSEDLPKRERALAVSTDANTALLQVIANAARDPKVDVAKMQALYAMHKDAMERQAAAAFAAAMADFKRNPPKIVKDTHVKIPHKAGGGFTEYDHASLGHVCDAIITGLADVGISHRWDLEQLDGGMIRVTCVLTHAQGHATRTSLHSSRDDSGSKNNIQAVGSTQSYLSRYTLLAATGLAAGIPDNDGRDAEFETLSDEEIANVRALIEETAADEAALLRIFKANAIEDIAAAAYKTVVKMLEARRKAK